MKKLIIGIVVGAGISLAFVTTSSRAGDDAPKSKETNWRVEKDRLITQQTILDRRLRRLVSDILTLKTRLQRSPKKLDKQRAKGLEKAFRFAQNSALEIRIEKLLQHLETKPLNNATELGRVRDEAKKIADDMHQLAALLQENSTAHQLDAAEEYLDRIIRLLNELIRDQKLSRRKTEARTDAAKVLHKLQIKLRLETQVIQILLADEKKLAGWVGPKRIAKAQVHLADAERRQTAAEKTLEAAKNAVAVGHQDTAIGELVKARDALIKIKDEIVREHIEETRKTLLLLCQRMLARQKTIVGGTQTLAAVVANNPNESPNSFNAQDGLRLAGLQFRSVNETSDIIRNIENGTYYAIILPAIFRQVRQDMKAVARRLTLTNTGSTTLAIEKDIAVSLEQIIDALQQYIRPGIPDPGDDPGDDDDDPHPPTDPDLANKVMELRLIRFMQMQLNTRTKLHVREVRGEQARDSLTQAELKQLAKRQQEIAEITKDIVKGTRRKPKTPPNADSEDFTPRQKSKQSRLQPIVAGANTQFALDLYDRLRRKEGNLFFSPFSISAALAMTSSGARGVTLTQMQKTLHFPAQQRLHQGMAALLEQINGNAGKRGYQLTTANALWGQQNAPFSPKFLTLIDKHYQGGFHPVDFQSNLEQARGTINDWVEQQTNKKIKNLLPRGVLDANTRLVLTNAIHFKGDWRYQFKEAETRERDFFSPGGKTKAQMMRQEQRFDYHDTGSVKLLAMPYKGQELSMVVMLPAKRDGLQQFENSLSTEKLKQWLKAMRRQKVLVLLPRFKMESSFKLKKTLSAMGMPSAFQGGQADFSGMIESQQLFIKDVIHKAFVEVNEKGTEAAATTAVVMKVKSARRFPIFRADHPFIFIIRDNRSGAILFMGRVERID